jgi:hypothetical protein
MKKEERKIFEVLPFFYFGCKQINFNRFATQKKTKLCIQKGGQ